MARTGHSKSGEMDKTPSDLTLCRVTLDASFGRDWAKVFCLFYMSPTAKLNQICELNTTKVIENLVRITFECHYKVEERSE